MIQLTRLLRRRLAGLYRKQRGLCFHCGRRMRPVHRFDAADARMALHNAPDRPTLDHLVPVSRGGGHDAANVVAACLACNKAKAARTPEAFQIWIKENGLPSRR